MKQSAHKPVHNHHCKLTLLSDILLQMSKVFTFGCNTRLKLV